VPTPWKTPEALSLQHLWKFARIFKGKKKGRTFPKNPNFWGKREKVFSRLSEVAARTRQAGWGDKPCLFSRQIKNGF